jgi:hypothetical protein
VPKQDDAEGGHDWVSQNSMQIRPSVLHDGAFYEFAIPILIIEFEPVALVGGD